ncbi:hypothetical protein FOMA001_g10288 [Fusarium oxysporum f. sp. matthiolae]|nr:hypothetical protein FOMA001_g10288 [Fusarium oxysporum f. sp. matthiolae]
MSDSDTEEPPQKANVCSSARQLFALATPSTLYFYINEKLAKRL